MHRLSSIILLVSVFWPVFAQSPHGDNLKVDCDRCHNPAGWTLDSDAIEFDHNSTGFELAGIHAVTDCKNCHARLVFERTSNECADCHKDIHSMSLGNDCARCHSSETWLVDNIREIHEENGFPLTGVHGTLSCDDCHTAETHLRFDRLGNECIDCHREDYFSTQAPDHVASGFSTNCMECHDIFGTGWGSDNFLHDFFPLTGGHDNTDCKQCHTNGIFSDASPDCYSCHQDNYAETNNPDHQALFFSTECTMCHTTNPGWRPADFSEHDNYYKLNGAHAAIANNCILCHTADYGNTPNTCFGCHKDNYDNTQNPAHVQVQFSTDCKACHNEDAWQPASFDHDAQFFPIYSGKHRNEWNSCTDCHANTSNYSDFTCLTCHRQSSTNNEHDEVSGYQYVSIKCLQCHPNGSE